MHLDVITLVYVAFVLSLIPPLIGILLTSWLRGYRGRRAAAHRAAERRITPLLIEALAGEGGGADVVPGELVQLSRRLGTELELLVTPLISSLRGAERARLTDILERNGNISRAHRRTKSWRARRRLAAVEFLGAVGGSGQADVLLARMYDRNPTVRAAAVRGLGRVGAVAAVPRMLGRLSAPGLPPVPGHTISMSVLRCGSGAVDPLVDSLNHPSRDVRRASVDLLGWLGAVEAADRLRRVADSGVQPGTVSAIQALERIGIPYRPNDAGRTMEMSGK